MGLFDGTKFERPVTCAVCEKPLSDCRCPRNRNGQVLLPEQQTAIVAVEKRAKGKLVTVITNLDPAATPFPTLLKELKNRCAAGGTATDTAIEIQGDHRPAVEQALRQMGYGVKTQ